MYLLGSLRALCYALYWGSTDVTSNLYDYKMFSFYLGCWICGGGGGPGGAIPNGPLGWVSLASPPSNYGPSRKLCYIVTPSLEGYVYVITIGLQSFATSSSVVTLSIYTG